MKRQDGSFKSTEKTVQGRTLCGNRSSPCTLLSIDLNRNEVCNKDGKNVSTLLGGDKISRTREACNYEQKELLNIKYRRP